MRRNSVMGLAMTGVALVSFYSDRAFLARLSDASDSSAEEYQETLFPPPLRHPPTNCTDAQLEAVRRQLPPSEYCFKSPWEQGCSITQETKCPESTWLKDYYFDTTMTTTFRRDYFTAINVGCNKGFDALNLLRMGTRQTEIRKETWRAQLGANLQPGVCDQESESDIPMSDAAASEIQGEVHCIEPMPLTVQALRGAANATGYDSKGFRLVQAAMANEIGSVQFPSVPVHNRGFQDIKIGTENRGLENNKVRGVDNYDDVDLLTLDEYAKRHLSSADHGGRRINVLLIDVEGFDFDVLLGGPETLARVEYLEFEYNWSGHWAKQKLADAVDYLDRKDFTCYWAGREKLWRITSCWLDHYAGRYWSNVACVQRKLVPNLAARMEQVFLSTVGDDDQETKTSRRD